MSTAVAGTASLWQWRRPSVLPGFGLAMGYTVLYLSLIVLIPLSATFFKSATLAGRRSGPPSPHRACSPRCACPSARR